MIVYFEKVKKKNQFYDLSINFISIVSTLSIFLFIIYLFIYLFMDCLNYLFIYFFLQSLFFTAHVYR